MSKQCEVDGCDGEYVRVVLDKIKLRNGKSVDAVDSVCNKCNDSLDDRLVSFIRNDLKLDGINLGE